MALQRLDLPVLEQGIVAQTQAWAVLLRQLAVAEVELLLTPAQDFLVALEVVERLTQQELLAHQDKGMLAGLRTKQVLMRQAAAVAEQVLLVQMEILA